MFDFFGRTTNKKSNDDKAKEDNKNDSPFEFDDDEYHYPYLYDEIDAMLQVSMLIYTMTELRIMAREKNTKLKTPERILTLPINISTCFEMMENNLELIQKALSDEDHDMTLSALQSIQQRFHNTTTKEREASSNNVATWFNNPFDSSSTTNRSGEVELISSPIIIAYGDKNPESELVYAIGIDSAHKRVTVVFRGSVTANDFVKDASIVMNHQPNPIQNSDKEKSTIGIHHGFFDYLLNKDKDGITKYDEIVKHLLDVFKDPEIQKTHKLYVTGHSLGGALAILFSFYVAAASLQDDESLIPTPISCISIASPKVGSFRSSFEQLERLGKLRHLRLYNENDPVPMMPQTSGKMIWAYMSPVSYLAFKVMDNQFESKETYQHTGISLKLRKQNKEEELFEITYPKGKDKKKKKEEKNAKSQKISLKDQVIVPDIAEHMGTAYFNNLGHIKNQVKEMKLNELYKSHAVSL